MTVESANAWIHRGRSQGFPRKTEGLMAAQEDAGSGRHLRHDLTECSAGRTDY